MTEIRKVPALEINKISDGGIILQMTNNDRNEC